jgi:hypothetical protein
MQLDITNKDLPTLLTLYNQEIEKLKEKLLNGESWENLRVVRRNITELAIAIQKVHGFNVAIPKKVCASNTEEVVQTDPLPDRPIE